MPINSIRDIDIRGKRVFIRCDFNVPLDGNGVIKDDTRIRMAIPTIEYALGQAAKCILTSHLGRPKGERRPEMSLRPVAVRLGELLNREVKFVEDCVGDKVKAAVAALPAGEALLLENLRFHAGETKNDPLFSAELASLADVYVNDAFGTAHRAHASTVGVPALIKEKAAGLLLKDELDSLTRIMTNPEKPLVAVFGGVKVSDKIEALRHLISLLDAMLVGGAMANTFLKAQGLGVGASRVEDDMIDTAREIMGSALEAGCSLQLPVDVVVGDGPDPGVRGEVVDVGAIPEGKMALDIGPRTVDAYCVEILRARTIVWNGPMGVFEIESCSKGTMEIAEAIAAASGFSVVGGGDTLRAINKAGVADRISCISTGGGAFMEFIAGQTLPGVAALEV